MPTIYSNKFDSVTLWDDNLPDGQAWLDVDATDAKIEALYDELTDEMGDRHVAWDLLWDEPAIDECYRWIGTDEMERAIEAAGDAVEWDNEGGWQWPAWVVDNHLTDQAEEQYADLAEYNREMGCAATDTSDYGFRRWMGRKIARQAWCDDPNHKGLVIPHITDYDAARCGRVPSLYRTACKTYAERQLYYQVRQEFNAAVEPERERRRRVSELERRIDELKHELALTGQRLAEAEAERSPATLWHPDQSAAASRYRNLTGSYPVFSI